MIPDGWMFAQLSDIALLQMGETLIAKNMTGDGIPVYSAGRQQKPWSFTSNSKKRFNYGTIIVSARGTIGYPRMPRDAEFISTQTTIAAAIKKNDFPLWLYYALENANFDDLTARQAQPMLTIKSISALKLLVPPLGEQRKIAAILGSVDALIERTQAVIDQLEVVKRGLMQELLTRGLPGRHTRFKQTEIGEIPESWDVVKLDYLLADLHAGFSPKCLPRPAHNGEWGVLKTSAVSSGIFHPEENKSLTDKIPPKPEFEIRKGDLLLNRASGVKTLVGRVAIAENTPERLMLSDKTMRLCVDPNRADTRFVALSLQSPVVRALILESTTGSHMRNISQKALRAIPVPRPPINEQSRISGIIHSIDKLIRQNFVEKKIARTLKSALSTALLSGDLRVTPDPEV